MTSLPALAAKVTHAHQRIDAAIAAILSNQGGTITGDLNLDGNFNLVTAGEQLNTQPSSGPFCDTGWHTISLAGGMSGSLAGGVGIRVKLLPWNGVWIDVEFSWTGSAATTFTCGSLPSSAYYPTSTRHLDLGTLNVVSSVNPSFPRLFIPTSGAIQVITPAMNASAANTVYGTIMYPNN